MALVLDRFEKSQFTVDFFFFNDTATTEIYTLSLHDALPICGSSSPPRMRESRAWRRRRRRCTGCHRTSQDGSGTSPRTTSRDPGPRGQRRLAPALVLQAVSGVAAARRASSRASSGHVVDRGRPRRYRGGGPGRAEPAAAGRRSRRRAAAPARVRARRQRVRMTFLDSEVPGLLDEAADALLFT